MDNCQIERTIGLLGEDLVPVLREKTIVVIGLGGVGGTALEALARTGFEHFIIVDGDTVASSNLNRQILYTNRDVGKPKTEVAKDRILAINPDAKVDTISERIDAENITKLGNYKIDFVVDAIDDIKAKIEIAKYAYKNNLPLIVSLGMANRLDPSQVEILRLDKTTNDPLARKYRHELKSAGVDAKTIMAVCSKELPVKDEGKLHSIMTVPSAAGLNISLHVISYCMKGNK